MIENHSSFLFFVSIYELIDDALLVTMPTFLYLLSSFTHFNKHFLVVR